MAKSKSTTNPVLELALKRFKTCVEAESKQREKWLEDIKFCTNEGQWPDNVKNERAQQGRPTLTINQIPRFVRQVTNDARMNRPAIKVSPVEDSDKETAEVIEGLCRHIEVRSNADVAYDTAVEFQVKMGIGYIRVITEYEHDDSFNQDICIKRVKNPFTIYFDPSCQEPDYSDARYAFVVSDMTHEEFKEEYKDSDMADYMSLSSTGDSPSEWLTSDIVRVAEYFYVEEKDEKISLLSDGSIIPTKDIPKGSPEGTVINERTVKKREVKWCKITGKDVLDEKPWAGKYIPIIPVLGDEINIDGKRDLIGLVRNAKDPQRMYNYWSSAQTEAIALAPKSPFLIAEGQVKGYEKVWASANQVNHSFLPYVPTSLNGQNVPPPQRMQAEPPVQAMVQAIAQASEDMKGTTGIYDAALGARSNETSGKAILARQKESDVSNFHYIDNLSRSIRHLGVILVDLIPKIYDAPRVVRILGVDQEPKTVGINQPVDQQGAPLPPSQAESAEQQGIAKIYDMTTGRYDVVVETGPSYSTKREQAAESMVQLTQAYPQLMQIAGDLMVSNMDWPGADEVAERLKKTLPPELQNDDQQQTIPPQVQAQMEQAQQMIDALTQQLNQLQSEKEAKEQELASKERIAAENNQTKLVIETLKAETNANMQLVLAEMSSIQQRINQLQQPPVDITPQVSNDSLIGAGPQ
jgi:hypothetical protein